MWLDYQEAREATLDPADWGALTADQQLVFKRRTHELDQVREEKKDLEAPEVPELKSFGANYPTWEDAFKSLLQYHRSELLGVPLSYVIREVDDGRKPGNSSECSYDIW